MTRLGIILAFGVVVVAESIMLGIGWNVGSQARHECETTAHARQAVGGRRDDVKDCVAARMLNGRAW